MRIADLHAHYPMHLLSRDEPRFREAIAGPDRIKGALMWLANRIGNYRSFSSGPRVTADTLRRGGAGLVLSVLLDPFDELDFDEPYGAPPEPGYARELFALMDRVERDLDGRPGFAVVRTAAELDAALERGDTAMVHAVEGGFALGDTPAAVDRTVAELARRGVGYVTLAHLFFRGVATNAPALPWFSDAVYDALFPQRATGLTALGTAAVAAMEREGVLVDLTHMRADALAATLATLRSDTPVIATHAGARFGRESYMLAGDTLVEIARRDGVVGLILGQHHLNDGIRRTNTRTLKASLEVVFRHVDRIRDVVGSHRHTALGTDLDGFVKPVMAGLDSWADLRRLEPALVGRYGEDDAGAILHGNAERVLRRALTGRGGG